jgi:hypothetical protein
MCSSPRVAKLLQDLADGRHCALAPGAVDIAAVLFHSGPQVTERFLKGRLDDLRTFIGQYEVHTASPP